MNSDRRRKITMIDRIIVNAFYLVPLQVIKFRIQHPEEEVIIADGTKARKVKSNQETQYGIGWVTARRGVLILTSNNLRCGDWVIPISAIQEATLLSIFDGFLLKISTKDGDHYQFGIQHNPAWESQKVIPLKFERSALKVSKISLILRMLILAGMIFSMGQAYFESGLGLSVIFYLVLIGGIISPFIRFMRFPKAGQS
jgi:hypothetical protein